MIKYNPSIAIVLCTYNGSKFLKEQLESFNNQTINNWHLFVYDDGSIDNTKNLVQDTIPLDKLTFVSNKYKLNFAKNFLTGLRKTPGDFDYYAFSDQDDIWLDKKLEYAVSYLKNLSKKVPAVYCSRSTLIDSVGNIIGQSPLFKKPPTFSNSLIQSIAGGNTMVLNSLAYYLIKKVKGDLDTTSHDWFIYQLISGAEGGIYYDSHSEILYRQHDSNLIGCSNTFFVGMFRKLKTLLDSSFKKDIDRNLKCLENNANLLTRKNKNILNIFAKSRRSSIFPRLYGFLRCGIYCQTIKGNIRLFVGAILNKI